jgi:deoxyhypusine synthase
MVDCIVTTTGGVEEDLMKCLTTFHLGSWNVDDKQCRLKAINRIGKAMSYWNSFSGNIFVPSENYGVFEDWLMPIFKEMYEEQKKGFVWSPSSMIRRFGEKINNEDSIYYWAAKNDIPVFCPALTDGGIGDMMFFFNYKQEGLVCDILQGTGDYFDLASSFRCRKIEQNGHVRAEIWSDCSRRRYREASHPQRQHLVAIIWS